MAIKLKTIREIIAPMSDEELRKFAAGEALAAADSSRIEGLVLDQTALAENFFQVYKKVLAEDARG
jgi:hypothetical protein